MYSYEEALEASTQYFDGDELAANVWLNKYALRDNEGVIYEKIPHDMHVRIAKEFARIEKKKFNEPLSYQTIFNLLDKFKYIIPQGSPMFGIGNPYQVVSLSNCYLLDVPLDSYSSILEVDEQLVNISKRRGGVGIELSNLRPNGTPTKNAARSSTGVVSWMERYSNSIREVGQNSRRGALMLTLGIHHPDILEFATVKNDNSKVTGANISVRLTKAFLNAVKNNKEYEVRWPLTGESKVSKKLKAKEVWDAIIHSAWLRAEPGILDWDNVELNTPADYYEEYKSQGTNPCSEINLSPLDSCRLLCLNLYSYVLHPFTDKAKFDYTLFYQHSTFAQRLMDDLVDLEAEKIEQIISKIASDPEPIKVKQRELDMWKRILKFNNEGRRTGTGITALADCLAALGIKYGSNECLDIINLIFKNLKHNCYAESVNMARELGKFKVYDSKLEENCPFIQNIKEENPALYDNMCKNGRRNICLTTIAPTGSVSILTQTSSGIEPVFSLVYKRRKKINPGDKNARVDYTDKIGDKWEEFTVYHPKVKEWMKITGKDNVEESPWFGCCAEEIDWINRVKMQAVMQKHICHSISSTVNLPENVSEETVAKIYETAFESGVKGITVYRKNCRSGVMVDLEDKPRIRKTDSPKRPKKLKCNIHHTAIKGIKYYIAIGLLEDDPYEVFIGRNTNSEGDSIIQKSKISGFIVKKKQGEYELISDDNEIITNIISHQCEEHEEAIARLTSLCLRHGGDIKFVSENLLKTRGEMASFSKAIARILKKYVKDGTNSDEKCPNCENVNLSYQSGCVSCLNCGYSKCN